MGDFFGYSYFSQKQTVQFENPAVKTYSRSRRIFWSEQKFPENLLEKVPVVHGRGPWRSTTRFYEKSWNFGFEHSFGQHFRWKISLRECLKCRLRRRRPRGYGAGSTFLNISFAILFLRWVFLGSWFHSGHLMVPTGQLPCWTLGITTSRIIIDTGVSYVCNVCNVKSTLPSQSYMVII